jgi:hypothetical protein
MESGQYQPTGYWPVSTLSGPNLNFALTNLFVCTFIHRPERLPISRMIYLGWTIARRSSVTQIKLPPERVIADVCLGLTVAGLYTLVGMGLIIAFM